MKYLNDEKTDLSNEMTVQLAIILEMIYASEIMCYRCARGFDDNSIKKTFFQEKKRAITQARKDIQNCVRNLEIAFDGTFEKIWQKVTGQEKTRYTAIQWLANDLIKLLLIYNSRTSGITEKRKNMQKALMNFKPDDDVKLDLADMLKYYDIEL